MPAACNQEAIACIESIPTSTGAVARLKMISVGISTLELFAIAIVGNFLYKDDTRETNIGKPQV